MKALVEASAACNQGAGIGRYARSVLSSLITMGEDDDWTFLRAPDSEVRESRFDVSGHANARIVTVPFSRRNADRLWFRLRAPLDARIFTRRQADVVYSPDFTAPPVFGAPRMITVQDLAFLTHPETTTDGLRRYLELVVPREVARADIVVAGSFATRDRISQILNVPDDRIVVARSAVDDAFYDAVPLTEERRKGLSIPERYLLMLGTIEPRKNHLNALRALEASGVGDRVPLVLAGRPGWGHEHVMPLIDDLKARGMVIPLQYVPEADLPGLVAGAAGMLYPSWTEGFGIPVAEAMATGIPVITGTDSALQEVGGPLARHADPADVDALAQHIREVVASEDTDEERQQRREWTRQFSWDYSTSTVYENLSSLAGKSGS